MAGNKVVAVGSLGSWKMRRRFMFTVAGFAMFCISYCLFANKTGDVALQTVSASFWLLFGILMVYVFGATTQDILSLRSGYGFVHGHARKGDGSDSEPEDDSDNGSGDNTSGVLRGLPPENPSR